MEEIKITCKPTGHLSKLEDLHIIQDDLKDLSEENYQKLKRSIIKKGFFCPFMVWKKDKANNLLDGTQRKLALTKMKEEGYKLPEEYPIVIIEAQNYRDAKERILAISSQYGKMTDSGLKHFVEDIDIDLDELKDSFVFDAIDFDSIDLSGGIPGDGLEPDPKDDEIPEEQESVVKKGDIWLLGNHRVMCGDSTNKSDVDRLMNGEKADMVFTDPPYNIASDSKNYAKDVSKSMGKLSKSEWDKNYNILPFLEILKSLVKDNSTLYIWTSQFLINDIGVHLGGWCDYTSYNVWSKPNPMPSLSKRHWTWNTELCAYASKGSKRIVNFPKEGHALSCWNITKKSDGSHPTQKPIDLITPVLIFSSNKGSLIFDGYLGSGSTLIACEKTNRKCYGMEIDEHYCNVIIQRYIDYVETDKYVYLLKENGDKIPYKEVVNSVV